MYSHTRLPLEMIWCIMSWCDFITSKKVATVFDFDQGVAYKYHKYSPITGSNFEVFEQIKSMCLDSFRFKSLMQNDQFMPHFTPDQLLLLSAGMGDLNTFQKYLAIGDPSIDHNLACRLASSNGHVKIVELLLSDQRVDPSDQDNYCLKTASEKGHVQIVIMLLKDDRVDPSASDNFAIGVASILGYVEIVQALLKHDRLQLPNEFWALRYAFMKGNTVIVDLLCSYLGLDINLWK